MVILVEIPSLVHLVCMVRKSRLKVGLAGHRNQCMLDIISFEQGLQDLARTDSIHIKGGQQQYMLVSNEG